MIPLYRLQARYFLPSTYSEKSGRASAERRSYWSRNFCWTWKTVLFAFKVRILLFASSRSCKFCGFFIGFGKPVLGFIPLRPVASLFFVVLSLGGFFDTYHLANKRHPIPPIARPRREANLFCLTKLGKKFSIIFY